MVKGASSLLFGGGSGATAGGLVNIVSKTPEPDAFGRVGVTGGADGRINPFFDLNRPLNEHVLFRVTGEYTREDPEVDVIETDRFTISPTPTLKAEGTSFTLQGRYSRW